jgi:hypothetical protein
MQLTSKYGDASSQGCTAMRRKGLHRATPMGIGLSSPTTTLDAGMGFCADGLGSDSMVLNDIIHGSITTRICCGPA